MIRAFSTIFAAGLIGLAAQLAHGQPRPMPPDVTNLSLHPAAATRPAWDFPLLPNRVDQHPGNAAQLHMIAALAAPNSFSEEIFDRYRDMSMADLAKVDLAKELEPYKTKMEIVASAARRDHAEWETNLRERGALTMLTYLNPMRPFIRVLCLKSRWQIARHDWEGACYTLQTGFAICDQLNDHPALIQGLVQCGMLDALIERLEDWSAEPGAPNLYWALSDLPQPLENLRGISQIEQAEIYFTFPQLDAHHQREASAGDWKKILRQMQQLAPMYGNKAVSTAELTVLVAAKYPAARAAMLKTGKTAAVVDAMSLDQVVGAYWLAEYEAKSADAWHLWQLPYWQGLGRKPDTTDSNEFEATREAAEQNPFFVMARRVRSARWQFARIEQRIGALRLIEAVRDYASAHDGKLPANLTDVTSLPLPVDAVTGRPFRYHVDGNTATVELSYDVDAQQIKQIYHLTIAH